MYTIILYYPYIDGHSMLYAAILRNWTYLESIGGIWEFLEQLCVRAGRVCGVECTHVDQLLARVLEQLLVRGPAHRTRLLLGRVGADVQHIAACTGGRTACIQHHHFGRKNVLTLVAPTTSLWRRWTRETIRYDTYTVPEIEHVNRRIFK